ncbi:MAG: hypothetical protein ACRCT8_15940 [Lacipirellulaceae bacterium]
MAVTPPTDRPSPAKLALVGVLALALIGVWGPQLFSSGEPAVGLRDTPAEPSPAAPPGARAPATQHGHSAPRHSSSAAASARNPRPSETEAPNDGKLPAAKRAKETAFTITLAKASRHDPFGLPEWSPEAILRRKETLAQEVEESGGVLAGGDSVETIDPKLRLEELKSSGVGMILVSASGRSATIGDRTVREGDEIDGFRVVEITATAVMLTPATSRGPAKEASGAP